MYEPEVIEKIQKAINDENVTGIMVASLNNYGFGNIFYDHTKPCDYPRGNLIEKDILASECKTRLMGYLYNGSDWAIVLVMGSKQMHFERLDGYKYLQTIVEFASLS
jgi:hypothetical protein